MAKKERKIDEICLNELSKETKKSLIIIGKNIKNLRLKNKLTQNDLAFYCYLDISVISKLERGVAKNITLITLQKLSLLFEVPLEILISPNTDV